MDGVGGDETPVKFGYTSMRDGKDVPVTGTAITAKTSVSKHGKTLSVT